MIARRLRMNTPSKSSITRLIAYLTNTQGSSHRVGDVNISGCESEEAGWAAMEMLAVQQQNTRAKGDKTYHLMVSFQEGERPSPKIIAEVERRICEALGYGEHQRLSVVHNDTENQHLHIAINKIHPEKLTMREPYYDEKTLAKVCVQLEKEFGLAVDNHVPKTQARPSAAINMEKAGDIESLTGWIQRNCVVKLKEATSWKEFGSVLAEHGLSLQVRNNGFVFTDGKVHVKASSVHRSMSKNNLEKRLGAFEELTQNRTQPKKRYVRQPMSGSSPLWEAYRREEAERRKKVVELAREERMEQREEAVQDFRLRNVVIKYMTSGVSKRLLYHLSRKKLREELKKKQWIDWLREKAKERPTSRDSSNGALACLRSRRDQSSSRELAERTGYIAGIERDAPKTPNKVTRKGTRIFEGGIKEQEGRLLVPANATEKELNRVLDFAELHFSRFSFHGSQEVKERLIGLSAAREALRSGEREQSKGHSR